MSETFSTGRELREEQSSSVSKEGQLGPDSDLDFGGLKQGLAEDPNGVTSACPPPQRFQTKNHLASHLHLSLIHI